jgi:hypothetical protein
LGTLAKKIIFSLAGTDKILYSIEAVDVDIQGIKKGTRVH